MATSTARQGEALWAQARPLHNALKNKTTNNKHDARAPFQRLVKQGENGMTVADVCLKRADLKVCITNVWTPDGTAFARYLNFPINAPQLQGQED